MANAQNIIIPLTTFVVNLTPHPPSSVNLSGTCIANYCGLVFLLELKKYAHPDDMFGSLVYIVVVRGGYQYI